MVTLYEHPLSPYAQTVKMALYVGLLGVRIPFTPRTRPARRECVGPMNALCANEEYR